MNRVVRFICFPYRSSRTWRCVVTTTVFAILSLTTLPVISTFAISVPDALLAKQRLNPRQLATHRPQLVGGLGLPHRLLDPQAERLVFQFPGPLLQLFRGQAAKLRPLLTQLHDSLSSAKRVAKRVLIGSLA